MLDLDATAELIFGTARRDIFRLQTLDRYNVASDGDDLRRYQDGEREPTAPGKADFLAFLAELTERVDWRVVHAVRAGADLSPYLRYQFEWGYVPNVAHGQQVRVLEVPDGQARDLARVGDFFVVDHATVLDMRYDDDQQFVGAEVVEDPAAAARFVDVAASTWALGVDFTTWWAQHPQFHRAAGRAA